MGNEVLEQIIKIKDAVPKKQRILCNYLAPVSYTHLDVYKRQVNKDNGEEFPTPMSTAIGESFIRFNVEDLLPRIAPRAVFVGHGYYNELHQRVEAEEAYRLAQEMCIRDRVNVHG